MRSLRRTLTMWAMRLVHRLSPMTGHRGARAPSDRRLREALTVSAVETMEVARSSNCDCNDSRNWRNVQSHRVSTTC